MASNSKDQRDHGWKMELKRQKCERSTIEKTSAEFVVEPATLAWLGSFASNRSSDTCLQNVFPWLWNPDWGDTVTIDGKGVKQLKHAVQCAETIAGSLDTFLGCVRKRLEDLQDCLRSTATKTYFPLLSDDILAIIFELASLPSTGVAQGEFDSKTPSKISQVSRRFRNVALKLPHLWRFIDARSQSWSDVQLLASRSAVAGEILEVLMESSIVDPGRRVEELYSFFGHVSSLSSRITVLRFELCLEVEEELLFKFQELGEHSSLSFPSLHELVLNFADPTKLYLNVHFYKKWDLPALKVLKARNIIPNICSKTVLAGISTCSLSLEHMAIDRSWWYYSDVIAFLSSLVGVQFLDVLLHGAAMYPDLELQGQFASLPTVEHLTTAFPEMEPWQAMGFCKAIRTPNKSHWTLEFESQKIAMSPIKKLMLFIFPEIFIGRRHDPARLPSNEPYFKLKELDIIVHCDFVKEAWKEVKTILPEAAVNLERFSVTYDAVQTRRFDLKNCRGRVAELVKIAEVKFNEELELKNLVFTVDGPDAEESEGDREESVNEPC